MPHESYLIDEIPLSLIFLWAKELPAVLLWKLECRSTNDVNTTYDILKTYF